MTPAGLHHSCLIPLIERGLVDCITTTGANLYHDAHRIIGHRIREIDPTAGDLQYRLARIIRIYDLGFWEETLLETDKLFSAILRGPEFQKKMTTPELHYLLGKRIFELEKALGVKDPSLLSTAYRRGVPIFVGAVQDGSIFLNIVKLKRLLGDAFKLEIDVNDDVFEMGSIQHHCFSTLKKKMAIWILGAASRRTTRFKVNRCSTRSSRCRRMGSTSTCSSVWTRSTTAPSAHALPAKGTRGGRSRPRASPRGASTYTPT